jgi:3-hydroxyisobutyrate dehydrogenase-like beta-hydroxyacid dehydrogenase
MQPSPLHIGIFGLGEAGSLFAYDLAEAGAYVTAYDPAEVPTPTGVRRVTAPDAAVVDANVVISLVAERDMVTALTQARDSIDPDAIYADFGTGSPSLMRELASLAAERGFGFVDVGLMATVPGRGLHTPALVAGRDAQRLVDLLVPLGARMEVISGQPGDAMTRKLLRSVVVKGLSALVIEAIRAAEAAGCKEWLWENVAAQIEVADVAFVGHLVEGMGQHYGRRTDEMLASANLLRELGVSAAMADATVSEFRLVAEMGVPPLPPA